METINHECYVSLEVAKLLKQAGFDWRCRLYFSELTNAPKEAGVFDARTNKVYGCFDSTIPGIDTPTEDDILRPTLDVAQRWLREVKECAVIVETHNVQAACVSAYVYCIYPIDATHPCKHINGFAEDQCFDTYEQVQEAGIKRALEILLEKGE